MREIAGMIALDYSANFGQITQLHAHRHAYEAQ
jgi:hypothetical protein